MSLVFLNLLLCKTYFLHNNFQNVVDIYNYLEFYYVQLVYASCKCDFAFLVKLCSQEQEMESKYALDEFWLQKLDFKRKVDASSFSSLHEARALVNTIFQLVVRNNLGAKELSEWQENLVFMEYLVENLGNHSHSWAMQKLKEEFGGKRGMSARRKKLADRIVRETPQRTQSQIPQVPPGPFMNLPPPPQQFFGGGLGMLAPTHPVAFGPPSLNHQPPPFLMGQQPPRPFVGVCYLCQHARHMATNCPTFPGQRPPQNKKQGPKRFGKRRP